MGSPGRPVGAKGKMTGAHADLLAAWNKAAGPETALKLMRIALKDAIEGREVVKETEDGVVRYFVRDCELLKVLMPYIARKMDCLSLSVDPADSKRIILVFPEAVG